MRARARAVLVVVAISAWAIGLLALAGPEEASFPGSDGRIAFGSHRAGWLNVFTMNPDGSDVLQLTHVSGQTVATNPSWSPDGGHVLFELGFADFHAGPQVWVMGADGSHQHKLFADPFFRDFQPSYSPDGATVVFNRCLPDFAACAIWAVDSDGSHRRAITPFQSQGEVLDFHPRYSPDGASIAFTSYGRDGISAASYVMNADGSNIRRITPAALGAVDPDWAPDGSGLVVWSHCCDPAHSAVWGVNPNGTGLHQLTHPADSHDFSPVYSPAGDFIALERDTPDFSQSGIYTMRPDGTGLIKIADDGFGPAWGPAP
jgi:Tol biopolymer transport system component